MVKNLPASAGDVRDTGLTPGSGRSLEESMIGTQSCLIICDPMDCSPPDSSIHEILQARILEWVAIPFFRESS